MAEVACFCGIVFSFEGAAAPCPSCGEVARIAPGPPLDNGEYRLLDPAGVDGEAGADEANSVELETALAAALG
ncbi:MAG: hypothetical protein JO016_14950 [Actinobacteria bacterium]|nr:hypothetical protein [Actinomycetota bacterium]